MTTTQVNEAEQSAQVTAVPFTTREVPWMKIGNVVDNAPTAKDAAAMGGLDFTVAMRSLTYKHGGSTKTAGTRKAIVREDNGDFLGVVSSTKYNILQYHEAFDFMDTVDSRYVAAGALKGGRQGFMVVKAPFELNVLDGADPHDLYAVLRTSHDCSRAIEVMVMPLRARCMNQLTLQSFSKNVQHRWSIRHTSKMWEKLDDAKDSLSRLANYAGRYTELVSQLADVVLPEENARTVLTQVIPARAKQEEVIDTITALWTGSDKVGFAGTGWGLVNAVSEYYDWGRKGGTPESRFLNAIEGQTHKIINKTAARILRAAA